MTVTSAARGRTGADTEAGHTTGSLAAMLRAELIGPADIAIERLDTIESGATGGLTFIRSAAFAGKWASSGASAALVTSGIQVPGHDATSRALLVVADADHALIRMLELFAPVPEPREPGVHTSAVVDPAAEIAPTATIGPCCVIGPGAVVEGGAVLLSNVSLGRDVRIGRGTVLHPGVVVGDRCKVGAGCILHAGVVLGADGFGYRPAEDGRGVVKVPHIGTVEIGDLVEIGANTCVDRAKFGATVIGSGTKIDNLVQIGHNCRIGRVCLICGSCAIAGSVTMGDGVVIGGGTTIADNLTVGTGAKIAGNGGVICDIPAGETWMGVPAMPASEGGRNYAAFRNLGEMAKTVRRLQKRLDESDRG